MRCCCSAHCWWFLLLLMHGCGGVAAQSQVLSIRTGNSSLPSIMNASQLQQQQQQQPIVSDAANVSGSRPSPAAAAAISSSPPTPPQPGNLTKRTGTVSNTTTTTSNTTTNNKATTSQSSQRQSSIDFKRVPSIMLVKPGGRLSFTGVELAQLADVYSYSFKADQPYINQAVGYVLWPSISLSPNATVYLQDVSASYVNPSILDSCEEYTGRQVIGLQSTLGAGNVVSRNATAVAVTGSVSVNVLVQAGDTQQTVGEATAVFGGNVTFVCLPNPMQDTGLDFAQPRGSGMGPSQTVGSGPVTSSPIPTG